MPYRQPGVVLTDHVFAVPLDHDAPGGERIEVFTREVVAAGKTGADLPRLLFLQGGPGFGGPRLSGRTSWLDAALDSYRVLLLDQRGTGRSTPVTRHSLAARGSARDQARYLSLFRADSIVADAEFIRRELGGAPWSVLGQSFGGFCTVTYLSKAADGIREAFITGGVPGLAATADDVYRRTYPRVRAKTLAHYARYPGDVEQARRVARHLAGTQVLLPDGAPLTVAAFQTLGGMLGQSTGSDELHYLLEGAFEGDRLGDAFLHEVYGHLTFATGPLYAALHEPCYAQGAATRWSAQRIRAEFPGFDPGPALAGAEPLLFTGEMIYPWMFEQDPVLRPFLAAAELVAEYSGWPPLYDAARLAANEVPVAAAVYFDDMYVPQDLSVPTAAAIRGLRAWVTNEYEHDGLRVSNGAVLRRLIGLAQGLA
ncbi:MAG TPA: alpha/beta fold hydrolase [Streptosporangiaceae bacterium]|nr:alpha/beta fold hydrolase [Streptosporangiaceae bacterium]